MRFRGGCSLYPEFSNPVYKPEKTTEGGNVMFSDAAAGSSMAYSGRDKCVWLEHRSLGRRLGRAESKCSLCSCFSKCGPRTTAPHPLGPLQNATSLTPDLLCQSLRLRPRNLLQQVPQVIHKHAKI